ncbi:unnamed protein product [Musa textilis]
MVNWKCVTLDKIRQIKCCARVLNVRLAKIYDDSIITYNFLAKVSAEIVGRFHTMNEFLLLNMQSTSFFIYFLLIFPRLECQYMGLAKLHSERCTHFTYLRIITITYLEIDTMELNLLHLDRSIPINNLLVIDRIDYDGPSRKHLFCCLTAK